MAAGNKCSNCGAAISETLASRTFRDYGFMLCLGCEGARSPQLITTKPKPVDLFKLDKQGESIPMAGISGQGCYVAVLVPLEQLDPVAREKLLREIGRLI